MQGRRPRIPEIPPPSVKLSAAAPTARTLSFKLVPENASSAAYTCVKADSGIPDAAAVLGGGTKAAPDAEGVYTVEGLEPDTRYTVVAAVSDGADETAAERLEMTTLGLSPAVTLEAVSSDKTAVAFRLTPSEASEVSYVWAEKGSPIPDAAALLADGTPADAAAPSEIVLPGLAPGTEYTVAAAAGAEGFVSEVFTLDVSTVPMRPAVVLEAAGADERSLCFTLAAAEADRAAYVCVKKGSPLPDAAAILSEGAAADPGAAKEYTVAGLEAMTEYTVAAAAAWGEEYSEVAALELSTLETLYEALQGEWTATWKTAEYLGFPDYVKTFTFDVTICPGANEATEALYRSRNRLCCIGWYGWKTRMPDDLLADRLDYWRENPAEADFDWGPKWFLELGDDGSVTVPNTYDPYMNDGDAAWSLLRYEFRYTFLGAANGEGAAFVHRPLTNITVSPDRNTVTLGGQTEEYEGGGGSTVVYPSVLMPKDGGASFFALGGGTSLGVAEVVLVRKTGPSATPRPTGPAPVPAGECIIR